MAAPKKYPDELCERAVLFWRDERDCVARFVGASRASGAVDVRVG